MAAEPILVKDRGEATRLILFDEEKILPYTTHRFVNQLFQLFFLDLVSIQQYVQERISKKQLLPIPISPQQVIFPLRKQSHDELRTRGFLWVMHRQIDQVSSFRAKMNHSEIVLLNGQRILVPYTARFVQQQIRDSYYIEFCFQHTPLQFPQSLRPSLSGQAIAAAPTELQVELLRIAESIRKYASR
ncbi:competence protein ComK [Ammoniphilus sp. CFH 90114]|uniref:competence protein ComK n=1 Tax=Ammoniphilus sp. CFH 90114 TaxID=2493665 RepID=UPI00100E7E18|nr:competence protein ComK [Ammoniphilus sp. CFH 90114]RXT14946.1 hypothetical protein EIZ39_01690 [Ammoniphilus sp. CFH 90114]